MLIAYDVPEECNINLNLRGNLSLTNRFFFQFIFVERQKTIGIQFGFVDVNHSSLTLMQTNLMANDPTGKLLSGSGAAVSSVISVEDLSFYLSKLSAGIYAKNPPLRICLGIYTKNKK